MAFELPQLDYEYKDLEPHIDAKTMEIHHSKHHQGYTDKFNAAIEGTGNDGLPLDEIMMGLDMENMAVRNNGGGYYNHSLFWRVMSPNGGGDPDGPLADAINENFGSLDKMKEEFAAAAATRFGSGWAWLCAFPGGGLKICSTPNQDNPLMPETGCGGTPILALDVWEHAYYLNYQNRRPDYIAAFWNVVNWETVAELYSSAQQEG